MGEVYLWEAEKRREEIAEARAKFAEFLGVRLAEAIPQSLKEGKVIKFRLGEPKTFDNVVGVGIGEKYRNNKPTSQLSLKVYVVEKLPENQLDDKIIIPRRFGTFLTDVEPVGRVSLRRNTLRVRPAAGGWSISRSDQVVAGTLGCLVRGQDGRDYILSNNHVMAKENHCNRGDQVLQPGRRDGGSTTTDVLARLHAWKPVTADGSFPNKVDAAIAEPVDSVTADIAGIGVPKGEIAPDRYRLVKKSGRTSQLTQGIVMDTDVLIKIEFDSSIAVFDDQILIKGLAGQPTPFSLPGDSGSAIIDVLTNRVCGLLFAGSEEYDVTFANKISNVQSELGVRVVWQ